MSSSSSSSRHCAGGDDLPCTSAAGCGLTGWPGRKAGAGARMSSRAVTGGRDLSQGRSIRSAAISARMTPIGRLSPSARAMSAYWRTASTQAAAFDSEVDDKSAIPSPVGCENTSAFFAALARRSIQRLGVEADERPPDAGAELGDGQVARSRQNAALHLGGDFAAWPSRAGRPGPSSGAGRCGPRRARSRCSAASWSAGSTRRRAPRPAISEQPRIIASSVTNVSDTARSASGCRSCESSPGLPSGPKSRSRSTERRRANAEMAAARSATWRDSRASAAQMSAPARCRSEPAPTSGTAWSGTPSSGLGGARRRTQPGRLGAPSDTFRRPEVQHARRDQRPRSARAHPPPGPGRLDRAGVGRDGDRGRSGAGDRARPVGLLSGWRRAAAGRGRAALGRRPHPHRRHAQGRRAVPDPGRGRSRCHRRGRRCAGRWTTSGAPS